MAFVNKILREPFVMFYTVSEKLGHLVLYGCWVLNIDQHLTYNLKCIFSFETTGKFMYSLCVLGRGRLQ